jgi:hypothetical protein
LLLVPTIALKLSARILHCSMSWVQGFAFALSLGLATVGGRIVSVATGRSVPILIALSLGLFLWFLLGVGVFGNRARTAEDHVLGWRGAIQLTGLTLALLLVTAVTIMGLSSAILKQSGH